MASLTHGVKKRMSVLLTRNKTVEKNISSEYTTLKHAILHEKETLDKAIDMIRTKVHSGYARSAVEFTELIATDTPIDAPIYDDMKAASVAATSVHTEAAKAITAESVSGRLLAHVEAYVAELKAVSKEFAAVEKGFVETDRYERKVGKLTEKKDRAEKKQKDGGDKFADKARRNMDKLESERAAFTSKLDSVIERMKKTNAKYETILSCTHTAFWLAEHQFLEHVNAAFSPVIDKCKAQQTQLVDLDITKL